MVVFRPSPRSTLICSINSISSGGLWLHHTLNCLHKSHNRQANTQYMIHIFV
jgi:hypothetical protein